MHRITLIRCCYCGWSIAALGLSAVGDEPVDKGKPDDRGIPAVDEGLPEGAIQ